MDIKAYQYMNEYLKERFPLYYKYLDKTLLHSNVLTSVYKEYGSTAIRRGYADDVLDGLIDEHMKLNHKDIWMSYNTISLKIKKIISEKPNILMYKPQEKILDYVIDKIIVDIIDSDEIDKIELLDNFSEDEIINQYKMYVKDLYGNLCSHIDEVIRYADVDIKCNKATYNYIRNMVVEKLLQEKCVAEVINGEFDDLIIEKYKNCEIEVREQIKDYSKSIINELAFPFGIPENQIVSFLNRKIFESGELSIVKVLKGEYDTYIINYGYRLKSEREHFRAQKHIDELIIKKAYIDGLTEQEVLQYSREVYQSLMQEYDCTLIGISTGRYDEIILKLFNKMIIKKRSVVEPEKPKKVKYNPIKKTISNVVRKLVIVAIVSSLLVGAGYITKYTIDSFRYNIAYNEVDDFDNYNYNFIYSVDNERVEPTAQNTLDFYRKVKGVGYNERLYGYLAFYSAYVNVRQDRLYIMDQIMKEAKWSARDDEYCSEFYDELSNCDCFLEFAMNRLLDMGCSDVVGTKYQDALEAYKEAMYRGYEEKPMNDIDEEHVETIKEIMNLYKKYCKNLIVEFSQELKVEIDNDFSGSQMLENNKSRRNI